MVNLAKVFINEVYGAQRRFTPWTPNVPVALGAVGILVDGAFEHRTDLESLGIKFKPKTLSTGSTVDFSSSKGVTVDLKMAAATGDAAKAHAEISFAKSAAAILQARGITVAVFDEPAAIARAVVERFIAGTWEEDWVFVSEVQTAAATTILICEDGQAKIKLDATGPINAEVPLSAGFTVSYKSGAILNWVGKQGLTPLFNLSRVNQTLWNKLFGKRKAATVTGVKRAAAVSGARRGIIEPADFALEDVVLEVARRRAAPQPPMEPSSTKRRR